MRNRGQRLSTDRQALGSNLGSGRSSSTAGHPITTSLLDLQRLAGNQAVAAEIGSWRNGRVVIGVSNVDLKAHPSPPPNGVRAIRESRGGGGLLGRTVASIESAPPLMHADAPVKVDKGWTSQAIPARAPEPYLEEWWPTAGRHEMYPHVFLDVSQEWEDRLKAGEDEHASDHTLGWQVTWGTISRTIAELAKAPGPAQATEEAARADLWKRFRAPLGGLGIVARCVAIRPQIRRQGGPEGGSAAEWRHAERRCPDRPVGPRALNQPLPTSVHGHQGARSAGLAHHDQRARSSGRQRRDPARRRRDQDWPGELRGSHRRAPRQGRSLVVADSRWNGPSRWRFAAALLIVLAGFAMIGAALVVVLLGQLPHD